MRSREREGPDEATKLRWESQEGKRLRLAFCSWGQRDWQHIVVLNQVEERREREVGCGQKWGNVIYCVCVDKTLQYETWPLSCCLEGPQSDWCAACLSCLILSTSIDIQALLLLKMELGKKSYGRCCRFARYMSRAGCLGPYWLSREGDCYSSDMSPTAGKAPRWMQMSV